MYDNQITDPFTGLTINIREFANKNMLIENPINKETVIAHYDYLTNEYKIPAYAFTHIETCSLNEAAELLEVTKMRVSKMCATGILRSANVCGRVIIDKSSVLDYMEKKHDTD